MRALAGLATAMLVAGAALAAPATQPATPAPEPRPLVSVKDSPGYVPLADPDSMAEKLGRRPDAKVVNLPFTGGARSMDALARAVCGAFHAESVDSMLALCVNSAEFREILWPEFPQSRPATGIRWDDAWQILWGRLNGGSVASVREYGGHVYTLVRVERTAATVEYKNFKLHNGVTLVLKDDEGQVKRLSWIRSVAERKGRFKIYSMSD
ncbi:MAG TPA: hypothetical protein VNM39_04310 [Verrucomicrobiae bacterium]|nr:hypothetical protein [Verrucomicrobiae bacterium]